MEVDPAAYVELRSRVMQAIEPKRRAAWLWAPAMVGLAAACIAVVSLTASLRAPDTGRPKAIVYTIPAPPGVPVRATAAVARRAKPFRTPRQSHVAAIKLLTDDPNVVILWLVDDKKGDGS